MNNFLHFIHIKAENSDVSKTNLIKFQLQTSPTCRPKSAEFRCLPTAARASLANQDSNSLNNRAAWNASSARYLSGSKTDAQLSAVAGQCDEFDLLV